MGKDIGLICKHSQSQLSTLSLKTPGSSSSDPKYYQISKFTTTAVPSVTDKIKTILFRIPKIPSIIMQPSQTMKTYSIVRQKKRKII